MSGPSPQKDATAETLFSRHRAQCGVHLLPTPATIFTTYVHSNSPSTIIPIITATKVVIFAPPLLRPPRAHFSISAIMRRALTSLRRPRGLRRLRGTSPAPVPVLNHLPFAGKTAPRPPEWGIASRAHLHTTTLLIWRLFDESPNVEAFGRLTRGQDCCFLRAPGGQGARMSTLRCYARPGLACRPSAPKSRRSQVPSCPGCRRAPPTLRSVPAAEDQQAAAGIQHTTPPRYTTPAGAKEAQHQAALYTEYKTTTAQEFRRWKSTASKQYGYCIRNHLVTVVLQMEDERSCTKPVSWGTPYEN